SSVYGGDVIGTFEGVLAFDPNTFEFGKVISVGDIVASSGGDYAELMDFELPQNWDPTNGDDGRPTWFASDSLTQDGYNITFAGNLRYHEVGPDGSLQVYEERGLFSPITTEIGGVIPEPKLITLLIGLLTFGYVLKTRRAKVNKDV
ncbi:MAG: hypothetical protein HRU10_13165, partial [Opitutales bacterium]|nr:hypothetical protein [Opitutales bacterium]